MATTFKNGIKDSNLWEFSLLSYTQEFQVDNEVDGEVYIKIREIALPNTSVSNAFCLNTQELAYIPQGEICKRVDLNIEVIQL